MARTCKRNWVWLVVISMLVGCAPYDSYMASSQPNYGSGTGNYGYNNGYNNRNNNGYDYNNYYGNRYPSDGYEIEYRKAQKNMSSQDRQAIINGITQRMLNSGWYPEGMSGNQLVFTKARENNNRDIYYKTVYTLSPTSNGYAVQANMKLKTTDSPYEGSLDEAARRVDDKTADILVSVKKEVEQQTAVIPTTVPVIQPVSNQQQPSAWSTAPQQVEHYKPAQSGQGSVSETQQSEAPSNQQSYDQPAAASQLTETQTTQKQMEKEKQQKVAKEEKEVKEKIKKEKNKKEKDEATEEISTEAPVEESAE